MSVYTVELGHESVSIVFPIVCVRLVFVVASYRIVLAIAKLTVKHGLINSTSKSLLTLVSAL